MATARRDSPHSYAARSVTGPAGVWLSETHESGWTARVGDTELSRRESGWGNAWTIPDDVSGRLTIDYPRSGGRIAQGIVMVLAWAVAIASAFSRRRLRPHATEVQPR